MGSWAGPDSFCGISDSTQEDPDSGNSENVDDGVDSKRHQEVGLPIKAVERARAVALRGRGGGDNNVKHNHDHNRRGGADGSGPLGSRGGKGGADLRRDRDRAELTGEVVEGLNERLAMTERRFLSEEGLPGRPWFRHVLQAPGLYLG